MKKALLTPVFLLLTIISYCQSIQITQYNITSVTGGINVNLHTISFNGADYIGSTYNITGNVIDVSACYSFNMTLPVLEFENDIFIPITSGSANYTININAWNSSTFETCDYYSLGDTETTTYLDVTDFKADQNPFIMFPNPTNGILYIDTLIHISEIDVYDIRGRLIRQSKKLNSGQLDLTGLDAGTYLIKMHTDMGHFTTKVLLQN